MNRGFDKLRDTLAPYIAMELSPALGSSKWWSDGVLGKLYEDQRRDLPSFGNWAALVDSLDVAPEYRDSVEFLPALSSRKV